MDETIPTKTAQAQNGMRTQYTDKKHTHSSTTNEEEEEKTSHTNTFEKIGERDRKKE